MKKTKFPNTLAVTIQNEGTKEEYFAANLAASDAAEVFNPVRCAIYKLVDEGEILCSSKFVPKKKRG